MTPTPKGAASATPVTDAGTLTDLVAAARRVNAAMVDERFHLGLVEGQTMVGYLDTDTGAFIAATIELHPVLWHSPRRTPSGPATATRSEATEAPADADGSATVGDCWHAKDCHPTPERPCNAYITEALRARATAGGRCVHGLRAHVIAGVACLPTWADTPGGNGSDTDSDQGIDGHACDETCRYTERIEHNYTDAVPADGTDHGNGTAPPPSRCTFGCRGCDECTVPAPAPERLGDCWHAEDCRPTAARPCNAAPKPPTSADTAQEWQAKVAAVEAELNQSRSVGMWLPVEGGR